MKRILSIIILAAAISNIATAQIITSKSITRTQKTEMKKGYRGFAEIGGHFCIEQPELWYGFDLSTTHGYQINRWLFLGVGIGLQSYKISDRDDSKTQLTLPLYADIKTYFTRTAVKPFAEIQIGYRIRCNKPLETNHTEIWGPYDSPTIYKYHIKEEIASGLHLGISVGVEYKRFSLKVMWRMVKETSNDEITIIHDDSSNTLFSSDYLKNNHLSFTLGVNF